MTSNLLVILPEKESSSRQQLRGIDLLHRLSPVGVAMLDRELNFLHGRNDSGGTSA
jgi:hypothetical protein